ncbi:putative short chain dehydrogenase [Encephalitozoon intestinalis ATCC 50506]|uniref:Short chain dehydrogenase n=1 Tax=Encephalitozoon intestinalis (strain ATCC 50506) TaxID=876142 RepID=E0S9X3_ENCIT|nr:putative short chain dehydrogenase [Encephalitozoon intestinalis ATCC 50506]ADM12595.1 putative short chain dehydrogenase [Encephalitozoon intestinalis ATCC 50506]UTX46452.1 putative 3-oxoacyl-(acyl-carrier-protein) reductase [Encephalitozoon intestinalis]
MFAISLIFVALAIAYFAVRLGTTHEIKNKKILVIGGSSGLGLAFARVLKKEGNNVTITSRSMERLVPLGKKWGFETKVLDINVVGGQESTDFDYIFCCPGVSYPAYFVDQPLETFQDTMSTNYLGTVAMLKHYAEVNKKPFKFVMIGSTLVLLTFPGFSSYSPTKTALLSLFCTVRDEMERQGVELYLYNTASILTPGFERENKTKPSYTKAIEEMVPPSSAEERAVAFLIGMKKRRMVASDVFTYLCQIRFECECLIDYILFPVSVAVVFIVRAYVKWRFMAEKM